MAEEIRPVVYISYSWITVTENGRWVRVPDPRGKDLADRLRGEGVEVRLDLYAHEGLYGQRQPLKRSGDPRDPWHAWAMQQIAESDVVLMLCTAGYVEPDSGDHGGAFWHWSRLPLEDRIAARARSLWWDWIAIMAECENRPQKFVPVGWGPYDSSLVPGFVRGATYLDLEKSPSLESLLRRIRQVWHERMPRSGVFISYAHDDDPKWIDRLLTELQPVADRHGIEVWTDRDIVPGDEWHLAIQNALDRAKVGVMLVSPKFLASNYIKNDELPKMLRAAESEGLKVFWLPIVRTESSGNSIARFQAGHQPDRPLAELSDAETEQALKTTVGKLSLLLGIAPASAKI